MDADAAVDKNTMCAHSFFLDEFVLLVWRRRPRAIYRARLGLYEPTGAVVPEVEVYRRERDEQCSDDVTEIGSDERPVQKPSNLIISCSPNNRVTKTNFRMYAATDSCRREGNVCQFWHPV